MRNYGNYNAIKILSFKTYIDSKTGRLTGKQNISDVNE